MMRHLYRSCLLGLILVFACAGALHPRGPRSRRPRRRPTWPGWDPVNSIGSWRRSSPSRARTRPVPPAWAATCSGTTTSSRRWRRSGRRPTARRWTRWSPGRRPAASRMRSSRIEAHGLTDRKDAFLHDPRVMAAVRDAEHAAIEAERAGDWVEAMSLYRDLDLLFDDYATYRETYKAPPGTCRCCGCTHPPCSSSR